MKLLRLACTNKTFILFALTICLMASCDSKDESSMDKLMMENDSLKVVADKSRQHIEEMNIYFTSISECLDSISEQENLLLLSVNPETNKRYSAKEIKERLNLLSEILERQRMKIKSLSEVITNQQDTVSGKGLAKMVAFLSAQLEEKEKQIFALRKEISDNKRSISALRSDIDRLNTELTSANDLNTTLTTAVIEQTKIINEGYVIIGDKKKLQQLGVLTKGNLFKKSQLNANNINLSACQSVDISKVVQIPLNSKKPKILTANPADSYTIEDNGKSKILVIKNPNKFWSLSNILVVQL